MLGTDGRGGSKGMPAADNEEMDDAVVLVLLVARLDTPELHRVIILLAVQIDLEEEHISAAWHTSNPLSILLATPPMDVFSGD